MSKFSPSRRHFMNNTGKAALATCVGLSQLSLIGNASAQTSGDYKALVCVLFAGGMDSFNVLAPIDSNGYAEYAKIRTDLALPQSDLLPLNNAGSGGKKLGLHPALTELQSLYDSGQLSFVTNVGTLVEPTSATQLQNGTARLPLGLYSHSDQINQWQTSVPDARSVAGWGGRLADMLIGTNGNQALSMSISLSGANIFQTGIQTDSFSMVPSDNGVVPLEVFDGIDGNYQQAVDTIYGNSFSNLFRRTYRQRYNQAIEMNQLVGAAVSGVSEFSTVFGPDDFSQSLKMIAKTIAANSQLGSQRQTFFVNFGGWDHHDEVINSMAGMLNSVNNGLGSFQKAMGEIGLQKNVTTFTTSDFGRTLTSNGRGSDHGWGGNHLVMGGSVDGGKLFGDYPDLGLGNPLDTGRGVLMPTLSTDQYFADLALWMGVSPSALYDVIPNIGRFYSPSNTQPAIGLFR